MKKYIVVAVCLVLGIFLVSSMAMATDYAPYVTPGTGIKGTAHDLSITGMAKVPGRNSVGSNDTKNTYKGAPTADLDRICIWCHTPHFSLKPTDPIAIAAGVDYLPLWNHTLSGIKTYTPYSNGSNGAKDASHHSNAMDQNAQPGGVSKLCLSCHDGNVAVNNYGRVNNGTGNGDDASTGVPKGDAPVFIIDDYKVGKNGDLSNHHPIGFDYVKAYNSDNEIQSIGSDFVTNTAGTVYTIGDLLWGGKMECTTCHDVHNTKNQGEKFLWKSDVQSALCLTCHIKDGATRN